MLVKKYEFPNEAKANEYITALGVDTDEYGNEYPTHKNGVVKLGFIITQPAEYDDEGNETQAPEFASQYSVDVCWCDSNDSNILNWSQYEITLNNEGVHSFFGLKYIQD